MLKETSLVLCTLILIGATGCYYDNEELLYPGGVDCTGINATFSTDVNPIIQTSCATSQSCHGAGANNAGGPLTNYTELKNKSAQIKTVLLNGSMPKGSSLPSSDIKKIICWIDSGAPNN